MENNSEWDIEDIENHIEKYDEWLTESIIATIEAISEVRFKGDRVHKNNYIRTVRENHNRTVALINRFDLSIGPALKTHNDKEFCESVSEAVKLRGVKDFSPDAAIIVPSPIHLIKNPSPLFAAFEAFLCYDETCYIPPKNPLEVLNHLWALYLFYTDIFEKMKKPVSVEAVALIDSALTELVMYVSFQAGSLFRFAEREGPRFKPKDGGSKKETWETKATKIYEDHSEWHGIKNRTELARKILKRWPTPSDKEPKSKKFKPAQRTLTRFLKDFLEN
ncbi:hypothetical protein DSCO28_64680 [Desulfosarcina ovata subsp. sediminis]|uniref:Uncharacterized protein n=1 Tax=Desulfosarcina ovata subsp. sediminis TaxID=885957 RepID=A0A5K8A067_9BACT|nr:hypothetical protein [Desulfosarcina ovata]BBO85902.1 hypothetical protein DSCO28_64680 [Desulfosarcina ovata subsp. sediminis]